METSANTNSTVPLQNLEPKIVPGSAWLRFWATMIDDLLLLIPTLLLTFVLSWFLGEPISFKGNIFEDLEKSILPGVLAILLYFPYYVFLTVWYGGTFGKWVYGLKVVKYGSVNFISYFSAVVRELVKIGVQMVPLVGGLLYFVNGLIIVFSKDKRGMHDAIAKTQVIRSGSAWPIWKQLIVYLILAIALGFCFYIGLLIYLYQNTIPTDASQLSLPK